MGDAFGMNEVMLTFPLQMGGGGGGGVVSMTGRRRFDSML